MIVKIVKELITEMECGKSLWIIYCSSKLRLSVNYLFDEFILDNEQKKNGKGTGKAYSFKAEYFSTKNDKSFTLNTTFRLLVLGQILLDMKKGKIISFKEIVL